MLLAWAAFQGCSRHSSACLQWVSAGDHPEAIACRKPLRIRTSWKPRLLQELYKYRFVWGYRLLPLVLSYAYLPYLPAILFLSYTVQFSSLSFKCFVLLFPSSSSFAYLKTLLFSPPPPLNFEKPRKDFFFSLPHSSRFFSGKPSLQLWHRRWINSSVLNPFKDITPLFHKEIGDWCRKANSIV